MRALTLGVMAGLVAVLAGGCERTQDVPLRIQIPEEFSGQTLRVELYVVAAEDGAACPETSQQAAMWRESRPPIHEQSIRTDRGEMARHVGELGAQRHLFIAVGRELATCQVRAYGCTAAEHTESVVVLSMAAEDGAACDMGVPCNGDGSCGGEIMIPPDAGPCGMGLGGFACCPQPIDPGRARAGDCGNRTVLREVAGACEPCSDRVEVWPAQVVAGGEGSDEGFAYLQGPELAMGFVSDFVVAISQIDTESAPQSMRYWKIPIPTVENVGMLSAFDFHTFSSLTGATVLDATLSTEQGGPALIALHAQLTTGPDSGNTGVVLMDIGAGASIDFLGVMSAPWSSIGFSVDAMGGPTVSDQFRPQGGITFTGSWGGRMDRENRRVVFVNGETMGSTSGSLWSFPIQNQSRGIQAMQTMRGNTPWSTLIHGQPSARLIGTRLNIAFWAHEGGLMAWPADLTGAPMASDAVGLPEDVMPGRFDVAAAYYPVAQGEDRPHMVVVPSECGVGIFPVVCSSEGRDCQPGLDFSGGASEGADFAWTGRAERVSIVKIRPNGGEGYALAWSVMRPGGGHVFYLGFLSDDGTPVSPPIVLWETPDEGELHHLELRTTPRGDTQHFAVGTIFDSAHSGGSGGQQLVVLGATYQRCS